MNIKYKASYLSNGDKVKITDELFEQLKKWEVECVDIDEKYIDVLKLQDNEWMNKYRNYYSRKVSLDSSEAKRKEKEKNISNFSYDPECILLHKSNLEIIITELNKCTPLQRSRFIMHCFYGFTFIEIARAEKRDLSTITHCIERVKTLLGDIL